ncbi:biopolymer transport protein ExbD [Ruegeria halocynthiae]|uniref:Biopolymer transport protein ExbD n=1 Tax=Ruegeria halocynthiae TaxID=985054 RepID=A0A1H2XZ52_9RHOB|nr:biopolymer transporter ExbD [Ruegeria halocynthiae]SDW98213.1 biopolymer transport protein ExbD [Ruegeria halocynthiae]
MQFAPPGRPKRKPSLTPMIDVVFLLLVFFMLASRFGADAMLPFPLTSTGGEYTGPPRLIDVYPDRVTLNGVETADLPQALAPLIQSPTDMLILRGQDGASLQRIVTVTENLRKAGYSSAVLVE